MNRETKIKMKNVIVYAICLLSSISMWILLKYNSYCYEQQQIREINKFKIQAEKVEEKKEKKIEKEEKTKKFTTKKESIQEKEMQDTIKSDTTAIDIQ